MEKQQFEILFNKCMSRQHTDTREGRIKINPCMIIRDFEVEEYPQCDREFTTLKDAWSYFTSVGLYSRIMDNAGLIVYCWFDKKEVQE